MEFIYTMLSEKTFVDYDNSKSEVEWFPKEIFDILWKRRNQFQDDSLALLCLFYCAEKYFPSQKFLNEVKTLEDCRVLYNILHNNNDDKDVFNDIYNRRLKLSGDYIVYLYCELASSKFADDLKLKQLLDDGILRFSDLKNLGEFLVSIALNSNVSLGTYNIIFETLKNNKFQKSCLSKITSSRHSDLDTVLLYGSYFDDEDITGMKPDENTHILIQKPNITSEMVIKLTEKWGLTPIDWSKFPIGYTKEDFKTSLQIDYVLLILAMNHNELNEEDIYSFINTCLGEEHLSSYQYYVKEYDKNQKEYKQQIERERAKK